MRYRRPSYRYSMLVRSVILPRRNERDVEDVPEELRKQMRFVFVDDADEVLRLALAPSAANLRRAAR
jgi:ATP-dependent Lon protease